jgi:hypothetical protein
MVPDRQILVSYVYPFKSFNVSKTIQPIDTITPLMPAIALAQARQGHRSGKLLLALWNDAFQDP